MKKNSVFLIIIIITLILLLYNLIFSSKNSNSFLAEVRNKEIKSLVIKKYINDNNHDIPFLVYDKKNITDSLVVYRDWWDKISLGDSIVKAKGSLELIVKSSDKVQRFNYEDKFGLGTP